MFSDVLTIFFRTYGSEECDKLVKIIQSRVVDCGPSELGQIGVEKELSLIASGTDTAVPLAWYKGELPKRISYSSGSPNILSPEPFFHRELAPDFHDKAVTEAKKWLEVKRTSSSPKSRFDYARCSLNTDMFHAVSASCFSRIFSLFFLILRFNFCFSKPGHTFGNLLLHLWMIIVHWLSTFISIFYSSSVYLTYQQIKWDILVDWFPKVNLFKQIKM